MGQILWSCLLIFLGFVVISHAESWKCMNDTFCVHTETNPHLLSTFDETHESQDLCRLICGKYRGLWPQPTGQIKLARNYIPFDAKAISFDLSLISDPIRSITQTFIDLARKKFSRPTRSAYSTAVNDVDENFAIDINLSHVTVSLSIASEEAALTLETDESYFLRVKTFNSKIIVKINANSVYGARHALETLYQLTAKLPDSQHRAIISSAYVEDRPIYKYRGLLMDTARNFIPLQTIRETLDAMGASKLNAFHWHITDAQSFPLEIPSVPYFHQYGAYSVDKVYKITEVQAIVQYARARGIRVILEIDAPAHASLGWNWGRHFGFGNLAVCVNRQPWQKYCIQPPCGQLNPVNSNVTLFIREIYQYLAATGFSGPFHMGGDEVHIGCWNSTAEIVEQMHRRGLNTTKDDFLQLWAEFQGKLLKIWDDITKSSQKVVYWSSELTDPEHIEKYLDKDRYIIQTWVPKDNPITNELLKKGYQLIISTKDAWYLDHGFWGTTKYYSWRNVYGNKILAEAGVLGGEACMWGEFVDGNSIHARIWPRAAALAERLWSDPITANYNEIETRLNQHRKRLLELGVTADALKPEWCLINEGECLNYNFYG